MRKSTDAYRSALKICMPKICTELGLRRLRLGPGLIYPGIGRGRLSLWPAGRRGDVADGDGDDPVGIEYGEGILGHVLGEAGDRVLVSLVIVGPDIDISAGPRIHHAFDLADEGVVVRPASRQLAGLLDGGLEDIGRAIRALGLEIGILVEPGLVLLDEAGVERPAVPARIS